MGNKQGRRCRSCFLDFARRSGSFAGRVHLKLKWTGDAMPDLFYQRLKRLKTQGILTLLCVIFAFASGILGVAVWTENQIAAVCFFVLFSGSLVGIYVLARRGERKERLPEPYSVPVFLNRKEAILSAFGANRVEENSYVGFCSWGDFSMRVLILLDDCFDADAASRNRKRANRKINQQYQMSNEISMDQSYSALRINLAIVEQDNGALHHWVNRNPGELLRRVEAIINAAVVLDEQKLLFPCVQEAVTLRDLNKYQAAAELLSGVLQGVYEKASE